MRIASLIGFALLFQTLSIQKAWSHARLFYPVPRSTTNSGLKTEPCGGLAALTPGASFRPGSTITVSWVETIQHPGSYRFSFSAAGEASFAELKTVTDTQDGQLGANELHVYTTTLTLPNVTCTNCILQMIQVMTDRNPPSNYYSCADIALANDAPTVTTLPPLPGATTTTTMGSGTTPTTQKPSGGGENRTQSVDGSNSEMKEAKLGCGSVGAANYQNPKNGGPMAVGIAIFSLLMPMMLLLRMRRRHHLLTKI